GATCDELAATIDLLPTVAALINAELPARAIDGHDIRPLLFAEPGARSPHEALLCYYAGGQLQAVRDRRFKLHLPHGYTTLAGERGGRDGKPAPYRQARIGQALYDLRADPGESTDVAAEHPDVVERLLAAAAQAREELGDTSTKVEGKGARAAGRL